MTYDERPHRHIKHKGQTLVEFALTLPILLLLIFGTIEFGRAFQAWITLENAAREAARYTTTGQYDSSKYDLLGLLPCTLDDNIAFEETLQNLLRGTETLANYRENPPVKVFVDGGTITPQTLFATYYDGINCHPGEPDDFERRKDIVRLASIYDVARRGATGLNLEASRQDGTLYPLFEQLADRWEPVSERSLEAGYFDVLVCSTRSNLRENSTYIHNGSTSRFHMVFDATDLPANTGVPASRQHWNNFSPPYCLLNELPSSEGTVVNNSGVPWIDAGGPGDRITVVVTLNHTLLTPIFDYSYITMQARRSGVNETFRTSRALNAVQGGAQIGGFPNRDPGETGGTEEPTGEPTGEPTVDPTTDPTEAVPTDEVTPPPSFSCDLIYISNITFVQNAVDFTITNGNFKSGTLNSVHLQWNVPSAPDMRLYSSALNGESHWSSNLSIPPKTSPALLSDPTAPLAERSQWQNATRLVTGTEYTNTEFATSHYRAVFINANLNPANPITAANFNNTQISVFHPDYGACTLGINIDPPITEPTPDVTVEPTPEPTPYEPNCANNLLNVEIERYETMGIIVLRVTNDRPEASPLLGINLRWFDHLPEPPYGSYDSVIPGITQGQAGQVYLNQIRVGALSSTPFSGTVTVWQGDASHRSSPTVNHPPNTRTHGTWLANYNFPPNSVSRIYLDFDGTRATGRLSDLGFQNWMLGGDFWIDCMYPDGTLHGNHNPDHITFGEPPPPTPAPPSPTPIPDPQIRVNRNNGNIMNVNDTFVLDTIVRQVDGVPTSSHTFRIRNIGSWGQLIRNGNVTITGDTSHFQIVNGASWGELSPNSQSDLQIRCNRTTAGKSTITVSVKSNATNIPDYRFNVECNVQERPPDIRIENRQNNQTVSKGSTVNLGTILTGQTTTGQFRVRNIGTTATQLSRTHSIDFVGGDASKFSITGQNWPALNSNGTANFDIACSSTTPGTFTTQVRVRSNASSGTYTYNVTCRVNSPAQPTPEPTPEPTAQPTPPVVPTIPGTGGNH